MNIASIRIIKTATNYKKVIQAITAFDNVLSGNPAAAKNTPSSAALILDQLLYDESKEDFDPFIYQTFKVFLNKKTDIKINMHILSWCVDDIPILDSIFGGAGYKKYKYDKYRGGDYFIPGDNRNIPIFEIFPFMQTITMEQTQSGADYYPISLNSLVSLLDEQCSIKEIKIEAAAETFGNTSWIYSVWFTQSKSLTEAYRKKGYNIGFKRDPYEVKDILLIWKL